MGGLAFIKHVLDHGDNLPIIVITNEGDEKQAVQAMKLGVYDYLFKDDIDPLLLKKTIYRALADHRNRKEKERLQEELASYTGQLEKMVEERTREIEYLNSYKELILDNLNEYIRVVDPSNLVTQYECGKILAEFGDNVRKRCYFFWKLDKECEPCTAKESIENGKVMSTEVIAGDRVYALSAIPLKNRDDTFSAIEVVRDITHHRRIEEELRHKRRLAAMGEMSARIAHEIRNPLNKICLSHEILKESLNLKGGDKKTIEIMGRGIETLRTLATDLLDYGRSEKLTKETIDIREILNNVISEFDYKIAKSGVKIVKRFPKKDQVYLNADAPKIRQVFTNVVKNAVESMPEGGILRVSAKEKEGFLVTVIADSGVGIPKENIERIFEPFFTSKIGGTGLGMAIVKHFIDMHDGEIKIESEEGRGTIVTITLPQ
ncbi:MAG: hypothetical protein HY786_08055 [Deltaproteobacteria bacterium]|nr:hypothetical protein [Deltaproteobacteria bacterium]